MKMFQHLAFLMTLVAWTSASINVRRPDYVPESSHMTPPQCSALREDVQDLLTEVGAVRATLQDGALNPETSLDNQEVQLANSNNLSVGVVIMATLEEQMSNSVVERASLQTTMTTLEDALGELGEDVSNLSDGQKVLLQSLRMAATALQGDHEDLLRELGELEEERRDILDLLQREADAKALLRADVADLGDVLGNLKPCLENICYVSSHPPYGRNNACQKSFCNKSAKKERKTYSRHA